MMMLKKTSEAVLMKRNAVTNTNMMKMKMYGSITHSNEGKFFLTKKFVISRGSDRLIKQRFDA